MWIKINGSRARALIFRVCHVTVNTLLTEFLNERHHCDCSSCPLQGGWIQKIQLEVLMFPLCFLHLNLFGKRRNC